MNIAPSVRLDRERLPQTPKQEPRQKGGVMHHSVLVLDDDPDVAEMVAAIATALGAQARFVCSAEDFFAELDRSAVDIVIIDLQMPGRDGLDILRELGSRSAAQVILTSGYGARVLEAARLSAVASEVDVIGVLPKPIRRSMLRTMLNSDQVQKKKPRVFGHTVSSAAMTVEDFSAALENGEIRAHFQPKVRLLDNEPNGFEALARWEHPKLGMITPDVFIPLASEGGLDLALFEVMLDQSLSFLAELARPGLSVAVNVPMRICSEPTFPALLDDLLARRELTPAQLILEVTEAGPIETSQRQIDALTRLTMRGFFLSIDDFGTGVSSLERLVRIPFRELKIDRYFARDIGKSLNASKLVRNLVKIAKSMEMSVTIEGIEDAKTMKLSHELGCDNGQGYFIAKAMPGTEVRDWLSRHELRRQSLDFGNGH